MADLGNDRRVECLLAGLGIDRGDHVLRHHLLVPEPFAIGAVDGFQNAELAGRHQRLAGLPVDRQVDEHALVDVVEVPGVVLQVLAVPAQFPGIGLDRQRGIRIERIVAEAFLLWRGAAHVGEPGIGLAGAVEHHVLLGIVAAGNPGRGTEAAFQRQAVPGNGVGIGLARDGVHAPLLLTGRRVVAGDIAAARLRVAATLHALHDRAAGDERAGGMAPAFGPVAGGVVPDDLAGLGVEREQVCVGGGDDQVALIDRHVAVGEIAAVGQHLGRQRALVFPDQVAGGAVERLHLVGIVEDVDDAVVRDRGHLGGTIGHRPGPGHLQVLHIVLVDLLERAVAVAVIGAPPHQPIAVRRIEQHLVGDGRQVPGRIGDLRLLRQHSGAREQQKGQSQAGGLPEAISAHCFPPAMMMIDFSRQQRKHRHGRDKPGHDAEG